VRIQAALQRRIDKINTTGSGNKVTGNVLMAENIHLVLVKNFALQVFFFKMPAKPSFCQLEM